jgi:hypothetical protein
LIGVLKSEFPSTLGTVEYRPIETDRFSAAHLQCLIDAEQKEIATIPDLPRYDAVRQGTFVSPGILVAVIHMYGYRKISLPVANATDAALIRGNCEGRQVFSH